MHTFWDWVEYNNAKRIHEGIVRNVETGMQNPRDWGKKKKTEKGEIVHNNKYCLREVSTKKYPGTGQLFELK